MSSPISSSLPSTFPNTPAASTNTPAANTQTQPTTRDTGGADTVKLSQSQQIRQLHQQGLRVSQIAFNLNLTVETVNNYLGIANKSG